MIETMNLVLIGLNHKTAPVEIRERLAFGSQMLHHALHHLVDRANVEEGMIVSTCNRVEVLAKTAAHPSEARHIITQFLYNYHTLPQSEVAPHLYIHEGQQAVRHVFRVASSLDSMVVGEPQILGQVKDAYNEAVKAGVVGRTLYRLLPRAFSVAKRVRTETGIASFAVSLSYVAVELARKVFEDLRTKTALLIGAGEMAELAAKHLVASGIRKVLVANRTPENAKKLAETLGGGDWMTLDSLPGRLHEADIIIASTGAETYVVDAMMARWALEKRRNRPMLLIDMSVPRNIDPSIANYDNLFVFDVDDLESVIAANLRERQREAQRAEGIIEVEAEQFVASFNEADLGPTVAALKSRLTQLAHNEFERQRRHLGDLTPQQEEAIKTMLLGSFVNKVMHPMIRGLREAVHQEDGRVDLRQIFELEQPARCLKDDPEPAEHRMANPDKMTK